MDISSIIVLVLTATSVFFLVYIEMKSRRNSAKSQQSSPSGTTIQTPTVPEERK